MMYSYTIILPSTLISWVIEYSHEESILHTVIHFFVDIFRNTSDMQ